ncbi:MAG: 2-succinyl-6-hydroxy-2,4-cyclohexadiene-1-carboxylate synthase, partial [Candidatus Zixiibacteriota bacterium]
MNMNSPYTFCFVQVGDKSNPAVLFLHGFLGSAQDWCDVASFISKDYWCISVDLPGHGKTVVNGSEDAYRMENCANGLVDFLDSLDIGKCNIVAYSMGGRLALYMAINFPDRFDRVILESTSPGLKTKQERQDRRAHDNILAERLETGSLKQFLKEWYDQPLFATLRQDKERFAKMLTNRISNNKSDLATSLRMMGAGVQPSLWDQLHKMQARLLLIVGEKDDKFKRIAAEMAPKCPRASI